MHAPLERHPTSLGLLIGVVGGLGFLLLAVLASIVASVASADADRWAVHSLMVRQATEHLFSLIQDAETGQRGFLLTHDPNFLAPFRTGRSQIEIDLGVVGAIQPEPNGAVARDKLEA